MKKNLVRLGARVLLAGSIYFLASAKSYAGWEVSWIDRFDGDSVNWDNWTAQIQANYNNEIQCYTDDDSSALKNYDVSDGTLKIIARKQNIDCPGQSGASRTWTSGRLNSKDKAEFLYGRLETRLRFLELRGGTWPAFWMLENRIAENPIKGDNDNVNWPNPGAGEIDVWEWFSNSGDSYITNFFNVHNCGGEVRPAYPGGAPDVMVFNRYAIEWTAQDITFYMNDNVVAQHNLSECPQYKEPMFALINVAVGGNLGGAVDPELTSATLEVDYIAHCVASSANERQYCNESTPVALDDDGDGVVNADDLCPNTEANTEVDADGCEVQQQPNEAAPEPSEESVNVISLFSDSYQNIADINYNPNWNQVTQVSQIQIQDNTVLKYQNLNYQGTDFDQNKQDVSNMAEFRLDYWTKDATQLRVYLISPGPVEIAYDIEIEQQSWQSVAIPISVFDGVDLTNLFQLKIEGNGTVFLDNLLFVAETQTANPPPAPPAPPATPPAVEPEPAPIDTESSGGATSLPLVLLFSCLALIRRRTVFTKA